MTAHSLARHGALATALCAALGACWPDVNDETQAQVDSPAAGGTLNRENTQAGTNSTLAPPGQGSALSDTARGRLPSAGVSGPTQGLSGAAPAPQNTNAQTTAQPAPNTTGAPAPSTPRAPATPAAPTPTKQP